MSSSTSALAINAQRVVVSRRRHLRDPTSSRAIMFGRARRDASSPSGARTSSVRFRCRASSSSSSSGEDRAGNTSDEDIAYMDLYALLGVEEGASTLEIKSAYRQRMKSCHPDLAISMMSAASSSSSSPSSVFGAFVSNVVSVPVSSAATRQEFYTTEAETRKQEQEEEEREATAAAVEREASAAYRLWEQEERERRERDAAEVSQLLNKAWHTLRDPTRRSMYDSGRVLFGSSSLFASFTDVPLSKTARPDLPLALFVDEGRCVGCRKCSQHAPNTFIMEPWYNVARVETQWADGEEEVEIAVACCPTDCIHTVPVEDLAMLEWIHRSQPRQRVVSCSVESMSGKGKGLEESPFVAMERFNRRRREMVRDAEETRIREERRRRASEATDKVNNVIGGWAKFWMHRGGRSDESKERDSPSYGTGPAKSCPLPRQDRHEPFALPP